VRSLLLALVAFAFSLALGEGVLRLVGITPRTTTAPPGRDDPDWAQSDPVIGWTNRPGTGHPDDPGRVPMHFWSDGERVSASQPDKPAPHRVLLLGCSFTQGWGVTDEETFAWHLNEAFPDVRFEDYGVGGYGTYQALLMLERLLRESRDHPPDFVVYDFMSDHPRRNVADIGWLKVLKSSRGLYNVPPHVSVEGGALVEHPAGLIRAWPLEGVSSWVAALHDAWLAFRRPPDRAGREATNLLLARMDREAREAGSQLVVVLLEEPPTRVRDFLEHQQITFLDCSEPVYSRDPKYRVGGVGHPNGVRHALWSDCIEQGLKERGLSRAAEAAPAAPRSGASDAGCTTTDPDAVGSTLRSARGSDASCRAPVVAGP
jgi:hypothetical protein